MKIRNVIALTLVVGGVVAAQAALKDEPDGAAVRLLPDGGFQVTAIGTGDYMFNNPAAIRQARKTAEMRAKAAIAKFMNESLSTKEGMDEATKNTLKMSGDGQTQSTEATMESVSSTMESIRNSASALLTGVVVLEDANIPASGTSGSCRVKVGVSSKTTKAAGKVATTMADAANPSSPAAAPVAGASAAAGAGGGSAASAAGLPKGWIVCVGVGSDRKRAVHAALVEGISQVYGEKLQNDERFKERMTSMQTNARVLGKDIDAAFQSTKQESSSETTTKTAGFVREYRIVKVEPKDGSQEATVHANIVNPRAGGTMALKIKTPSMRVEDRAAVYQLGPKVRMSGAEVAKAFQFALPNGLAKSNKFLILTDNSLKSVIDNKAQTEAMVKHGLANASELMQVGQGLTPDFSITSELSDIKYSKKMGQDKKTKKFGTVCKMSAKLNVTLMNERTGQAVKSDVINLSLDNDDIKSLLEEDEDADLFAALLSKLAEPIEAWMTAK